MADFYLARFEDGPAKGDHTLPKEIGWPLPDFLFGLDSVIMERWVIYDSKMMNPSYEEKWIEDLDLRPDVVYEKVGESELPDSVDEMTHVARGARYQLLDEIPMLDEEST